MALKRQMEVIANNIANTNTIGFKSEQMLFREYLTETQNGRPLSMVQGYAIDRNMRPGEAVKTSNPLDLSLMGGGFFVVETDDGPRYTRSGHFQLDAKGTLINAQGQKVKTVDNRDIIFTPDEGSITVASDGTVSTRNGVKGRLQIVEFDSPKQLNKMGEGLYQTDMPTNKAKDTFVTQGQLEQSNVQPVIEMTRMIEVMRAYQGTKKTLETDHDLQRQAYKRLAKVN